VGTVIADGKLESPSVIGVLVILFDIGLIAAFRSFHACTTANESIVASLVAIHLVVAAESVLKRKKRGRDLLRARETHNCSQGSFN
jgi:hypothetical protein